MEIIKSSTVFFFLVFTHESLTDLGGKRMRDIINGTRIRIKEEPDKNKSNEKGNDKRPTSLFACILSGPHKYNL